MKNLTLIGISLLVIATGCSKSVTQDGQSSSTDSSGTSGTTSNPGGGSTTSTTNITQVICDPLNTDPSIPGAWSGLKGSLRYFDPALNSSSPSKVADLLANGILATPSIYMSELNVPTHLFNEGFTTTSGTELTTSGGADLLENFSLSFDSKLRLADYDQPGLKQFAVLSDDGAIFYLDQGQGLSPVVNNDGLHPSKMGCAANAVWMGHEQDYPIHIDYYQGPRYHIALMLLWRDIKDQSGTGEQNSAILDPSDLLDPTCGQSGNNMFFDPSTIPSTPTAVWEQMRDRGWSVVPAVNFILPGQEPNPCATPTSSS